MSHTHRSTVAESISSSSRPLIHDNDTINNQRTTATMSDINGKAPVNGGSSSPRLGEPIIKVQPPRREDLQPSYASVIQPYDADADTNGWYGGMVN
jgi:hypothetical protein